MSQIQAVDIDEVLVARAVLYGLLQRVFSDTPDADLTRNESGEVMGQCFEVLRAAYGLRDCRITSADKVAACASNAAVSDGSVWTMEGEYNRLFVGVGKPAVCLWESIYLTGVNALFQPNTLAVRKFYASWGFEARDKGRVADDHMAIELAFLRELAIQTTQETAQRRGELLGAQRAFLSEHMIRWVDAFADQVIENDRSGYYAGYAQLLADFVGRDASFLANLPAELSEDLS